MWCFGAGNFLPRFAFGGFGFSSLLWIALAIAWIILAVKVFSKSKKNETEKKG
jgi:heme exporter protein D